MASMGDKFVYFLVGGFVGAAVGLLFAPKSGTDTRRLLEERYREETERLTQKAREGRERVSQRTREAANVVTDRIEKGKDVFIRQKEQFLAAVEAGKEAYQDEKHRAEGPFHPETD